MKPIRAIAFLLLVGLWIAPSIAPAQDNNSCSTIVQDALAVTDSACDGTGRNQACYGNIQLEAVTRPEFGNIRFTQQGDLADVGAISTLTLSSMDDEADEWGVALMRLQTNLPDTLPGQNVTFLLFGDVEIENAVPSNTEPVTFEVAATGNVNVRRGPSTDDEIVGRLSNGQSALANGRLVNSSWLRVELADGDAGWVFSELVTPDGDISTLNVVAPTDADLAQPFRPMQAFYFRSGVGDAPCAEAPDSGILIQTPEGVGEISLVVNEVHIALGSTAYLQAQAPGELIINTIENQARAAAFGVSQTAVAGTRLRVPLDANRAASGPPLPPEPYDFQRLQALPLVNLPRQVTLLPAQGAGVSTATPGPTATPPPDDQQAYTDAVDDVVICNDMQTRVSDPEADITSLTISTNTDGSLNVQVTLRVPLVNDYSFALVLIIATRESGRLWKWELHDGVFQIGQTDPATGEIIPGSEERVTIQHDRTAGVVSFDIPLLELPDTFNVIAALSFHSLSEQTPPQPSNCDFIGPFDFPDFR